MERPHRVLEKKLHELEVRFTDLFFPSSANSIASWADPAADHQSLSKEIEARVDFLKNLLSIEKECHPHAHAPSHLLKLEDRLDGLHTAFRDWMGRADPLPMTDHVPRDVTDCSCTRSCFSSDHELDKSVKDLEEEGTDSADPDCFELDIKEGPMVLDVNRSEQQQFEGEQKQMPEYYHPKSRLLGRIVVLVGAAAAVSVGITVLISQLLGGFQDDVFLVPT